MLSDGSDLQTVQIFRRQNFEVQQHTTRRQHKVIDCAVHSWNSITHILYMIYDTRYGVAAGGQRNGRSSSMGISWEDHRLCGGSLGNRIKLTGFFSCFGRIVLVDAD
ncbi:hypothetical protein JOM56_014106 [Amanita muscaria]